MKPWHVIGRTRSPDGSELTLTQHLAEFAILADGQTLMSSRLHGSEDALATLGCDRARTLPSPQILIGGLGMGFTLRAALDLLPGAAHVLVAELVPAVVVWNRGPLGALAGHPLNDPRVDVDQRDVALTLRSHPGRFDAVLLDVDNGPAALTAAANESLYSERGLAAARAALAPDGVLAFWAAGENRAFERRVHAAGLVVRPVPVRAGRNNRGARHTILIAHSRGRAAVTPAAS